MQVHRQKQRSFRCKACGAIAGTIAQENASELLFHLKPLGAQRLPFTCRLYQVLTPQEYLRLHSDAAEVDLNTIDLTPATP